MTDSSLTLTVSAGPHDRRDCPVSVTLPQNRAVPAAVELEDVSSGRRIPAQPGEAKGGGVQVSWIEPDLPAGAARTYRLHETQPARGGLSLVEAGAGVLEVRQDGALVTAYHHGEEVARPFLYPLLGPGERAVTRHVDLAQREGEGGVDHIHHRSVWVAHGEVN